MKRLILIISALALGTVPALAVDELRVRQIADRTTSEIIATARADGDLENLSGFRRLAVALGPELPGPFSATSVLFQSGMDNTAFSLTRASNFSYVSQVGTDNTSILTMRGISSAVLVDQRGSGLHSEIDIDPTGANKLVVHVQRGTSALVPSDSLSFSGSGREAVAVLDTQFGRLTKTVAP